MSLKKKFPSQIKKKVIDRSQNRCERCKIDFDDDCLGEFHHIKPVVYGGKNTIENCTLLCHNCHLEAPNVKNKEDLLIYKYLFLRFASFKEAAEYYGVKDKLELYTRVALEIANDTQ
jgi:hypothetical protein